MFGRRRKEDSVPREGMAPVQRMEGDRECLGKEILLYDLQYPSGQLELRRLGHQGRVSRSSCITSAFEFYLGTVGRDSIIDNVRLHRRSLYLGGFNRIEWRGS